MRTDIGRLRFLLRALFVAASLLVAAVSASAQVPAHNFQELALKVTTGDSIFVIDRTGRELQAKVLELSPSSLVVSADGVRRVLTESEVMTIRQRLSDPLWQGALIGLGIGAGLGVLSASFSESCSHDSASCAGGVLMMAGMGAGIGVGIDALIKGRKIIYSTGTNGDNSQVSIVPIVTRQIKAAVLSVQF